MQERYIADKYLTVNEMTAVFGVSVMTIYKWRKFQELPYFKVSPEKRSEVKFDIDEVLNWAKKRDKKIYKDPWQLKNKASA